MEMMKYEVGKLLGSGSFGKVYVANRKADDLRCVLKIVNLRDLPVESRLLALNESRLISQLDHKNIIKYYDSFIENENLVIIMEYAAKGDLEKLIKEQANHIAEEKLWSYLIQICEALKYMHAKRVLHRDIKPQNVFLDADDNIKIGDFGLGRVLGAQSMFAYTGVGTPLYVSPEMVEELPYNEKSDIWSLGCLMYELAAKRPPFVAKNQIALAKKIVSEQPPPLPKEYSMEFQFLLSKMLEKNVSKRPDINQVFNYSAIKARIEKSKITQNERNMKILVEKMEKQFTDNYKVLESRIERQMFLLEKLQNIQSQEIQIMHKKNVELYDYCKQLEAQQVSKDDTIAHLRQQLSTLTKPATTHSLQEYENSNPAPVYEPPLTPSKQNKIPLNYGIKASPASPTKQTVLFNTPSSPHKPLLPTSSPQKHAPSPSNKPLQTPPSPSRILATIVSPEKRAHKPKSSVKENERIPSAAIQFAITAQHVGIAKEMAESTLSLPTLYIWYRIGSSDFENIIKPDHRIHSNKVWENKSQHHITPSTKNIILYYKVNSSLNYSPAIKALRVRYQGEQSFSKVNLTTNPTILNGSQNFYEIVQNHKEICEFILEFDIQNAVDEVFILKHDKKFTEMVLHKLLKMPTKVDNNSAQEYIVPPRGKLKT